MRIFAIVSLFLLASGSATSEQFETQDPYWLNMVSVELKLNANGQRVISSWSQKRLERLGDRVSVSILKILEPDELKDPEKVQTCLSIIRRAYVQPHFISFEADKDPKVTLFLLEYWKQNINDP